MKSVCSQWAELRRLINHSKAEDEWGRNSSASGGKLKMMNLLASKLADSKQIR